MKTIKLDKQTARKITNGIKKPFKKTRQMFLALGTIIDRDAIMTFKGEGARKGYPKKWIDYGKGKGVHVYQNKDGTWQRRPGTDNSKTRRYSIGSRLLQASGGFKQSFRILQTSKNRMLYGTRHRLAEYIMSNPTRNVLQYTNQDQKRYGSLISNWISRGIKF